MSQPGMISHGLPPRDNDVQRELAELRRRIQQMHGMIVQAITGQGGITIGSGSLQSLYPDGKFSTRIGEFPAYDDNLNAVTVIGVELDLDATYAGIGRPEVQQPFMRAYRNVNSGATSFYVIADNVDLWRTTGELRLAGSGTNQYVLLDASGNVVLSPDTNAHVQAWVGTTASAANAYIDPSTANLLRSTSSRRYKQDIADADLDTDALLRLEPRRFRSKAEVEEQGDAAPEHVGFIAEEAADLGLDEFVTRDDEGPEAFSYAGYVVGLQAIVRHQAQQIADLTARLERLEQAEPHEAG